MSSSDKNEQRIACPICDRRVPFSSINDHLDICADKSAPCGEQQTLTYIDSVKKRRKDSTNTSCTQKDNEIEQVQDSPIVNVDDVLQDSRTENSRPSYPIAENVELRQLKKVAHVPLSEKLRPKTLNEYVGQQHILSRENGVLFKYINQGTIPSMILWGAPGVGKTSLARLLTKTVNEEHKGDIKYILVETSATKATSQELRIIFEKSGKEFRSTRRMTALFIDEIHRFNKSQQDLLLPQIESGDIVLIGATTENPSFQLNNALISRCHVFILNKLTVEELNMVLTRGIAMLNKFRRLIWNIRFPLKLSQAAVRYIADVSVGDTRKALNLLEVIEVSTRDKSLEEPLSLIEIKDILASHTSSLRVFYDAKGDFHYDTISAFHKSIRGSDENATLYYLARMLNSGEDPLFIARRMIRIASEDVGLIDCTLLPLAVAAHDAVMKVGLPEADLALAQCAVALARAQKSVELYRGWKNLKSMLSQNKYQMASSEIPLHLRNAPTTLMETLGYSKGYKYNPNYKDGQVKQEYFPKEVMQQFQSEEWRFLNGQHLGDMVDKDLT